MCPVSDVTKLLFHDAALFWVRWLVVWQKCSHGRRAFLALKWYFRYLSPLDEVVRSIAYSWWAEWKCIYFSMSVMKHANIYDRYAMRNCWSPLCLVTWLISRGKMATAPVVYSNAFLLMCKLSGIIFFGTVDFTLRTLEIFYISF